MKSSPILYIFIHVPKCAGSTLSYHLRENLRPGEFFPAHYSRIGNARREDSRLFTREDLVGHLFSLENKDAVKAAAGHLAYYGMHECFGRPARYVTFLRHPVARTVSHYNFLRTRLGSNRYLTPGLREDLMGDNGEPLGFEAWLEKSAFWKNYMTKFFHSAPETEDFEADASHLNKIKADLAHFYFVGKAENYRKDALFLYYKLGIRKQFPDRNVTEKKYAGLIGRRVEETIVAGCALDMELYEWASVLNRRIKRRPDYFFRPFWRI